MRYSLAHLPTCVLVDLLTSPSCSARSGARSDGAAAWWWSSKAVGSSSALRVYAAVGLEGISLARGGCDWHEDLERLEGRPRAVTILVDLHAVAQLMALLLCAPAVFAGRTSNLAAAVSWRFVKIALEVSAGAEPGGTQRSCQIAAPAQPSQKLRGRERAEAE